MVVLLLAFAVSASTMVALIVVKADSIQVTIITGVVFIIYALIGVTMEIRKLKGD